MQATSNPVRPYPAWQWMATLWPLSRTVFALATSSLICRKVGVLRSTQPPSVTAMPRFSRESAAYVNMLGSTSGGPQYGCSPRS